MSLTDIGLIVVLAAQLGIIALLIAVIRKPNPLAGQFESLEKSHERTERVITTQLSQTRDELGKTARAQRQELAEAFKSLSTASLSRMEGLREDSAKAAATLRGEVVTTMTTLSETINNTLGQVAGGQKTQLEVMSAAIAKLETSNEKKLEAIRATVEGKLQALQSDNAKQLEQMRQTVDEKLQSTLEKRLGESFKQVSERLELVHKGLGEMQSLAVGVGDLKKVLTNVKARGTWGEVQLGSLLEQVLSADQFDTNVATKDAGERVEFAIKLPGQSTDESEVVWLPIDAKFPIEDYQRLVEAQERADLDAMESAGKQLEACVKLGAARISSKYLNPPNTTDFAILFLPIEGLFAEVARRVSLLEFIQREHRVVVAGPTTLWSLLNSLQMGFRTLAIQKRSSEVWSLLAAVKTEWSKYGTALEAVQKKLHQASESLDKVHVRTRAVGRKLRDVHELPAGEAIALLPTDVLDVDDEETDDNLMEAETEAV